MELLASGLCRYLDASVRLVARLDNKLFQVTDSDNVCWNEKEYFLAFGVEDVLSNFDGYELNCP